MCAKKCDMDIHCSAMYNSKRLKTNAYVRRHSNN